MNRHRKGVCLGVLTACLGGAAWYKRMYQMPLKEYTRQALYMAALDDEICRNELEGERIGGEVICFPSKAESLQYRYHLFLAINRGKSRKTLQAETAEMERRLEESKTYLRQPRGELEVEIVPGGGA